jgi:hypothetical protein
MTEITKLIERLESFGGPNGPDPNSELMWTAAQALRGLTIPRDGVEDGEIPYGVIVELYNSTLNRWLPIALKKLPPMRRHTLAKRWGEDKERQSIVWWAEYWKRISRSDFLCGRAPPRPGHENWIPNFDWLIKSGNMTKVLEGTYDPRGPRTDVDNISRFR